MTYQYTWVPMLQAASGCTPGGLPGSGGDWLKAIEGQTSRPAPAGAGTLGFNFVSRPAAPAQQARPHPDHHGMGPQADRRRRQGPRGEAPYSEKVPNVDEGFTQADMKDPQKAAGDHQGHPGPPATRPSRNARSATWSAKPRRRRQGPASTLRPPASRPVHHQVPQDLHPRRDERRPGHRPARYNDQDDTSEYEEILPTSPP